MASPPPHPTPVSEPVAAEPRLPRLEDFPEAGPNALATFQQRGIARVLDELIVSVPLIYALGAVVATWGDTPDDGDVSLPLLLLAATFAVQLVYEIVAVAIWGQSLGKLATGIRVARYTDGSRPTWTQSALRCLSWATPGALGLVVLRYWAIGALPVFLTAWRDPLRRALHDEAGGTIVVRTR